MIFIGATKLNDGTQVLAKLDRDGDKYYPYTFANRTQAENAAKKHGGTVIQRGRPFYVRVGLFDPQ